MVTNCLSYGCFVMTLDICDSNTSFFFSCPDLKFSDQRLNLCPLQCKHGVLTTGTFYILLLFNPSSIFIYILENIWSCPALSIYTWSPVTINFSRNRTFSLIHHCCFSALVFAPFMCVHYAVCAGGIHEEAIVSSVCFTYI